MSFTRSILTRNNNIERVLAVTPEEILDLLVHLVYESQLVNVFAGIFLMIDFSLDDHWIVSQF